MQFPFENYNPVVSDSVFVAPTAVIIGRTTVGDGTSIWFHTVIRADINKIEIGSNTNIQDGCLLHVTHKHSTFVGDRVTVGHGAILHGCRVESDCLVSMGAVVLDGATVGAGSIVAAGAVVAPGAVIPPGSMVMGIPAKVVRQVTEEDKLKIDKGWQNYLHYSGIYRGMTLKTD
jgi:carbonic anhydrase/acetyltransferase-like protein (isoleucine patch superfamily)